MDILPRVLEFSLLSLLLLPLSPIMPRLPSPIIIPLSARLSLFIPRLKGRARASRVK